MDSRKTEALFLLTGLFTACGAFLDRQNDSYSDSNVSINHQATLVAEQIAHHYNGTSYGSSASNLVEISSRENNLAG